MVTVNTNLNTFSTMMSMSSSRGRTKKMTFFTSAGGTLPLFRVNIFSTSCSLTMAKERNFSNICHTKQRYLCAIKLYLMYSVLCSLQQRLYTIKLCTEITCLEKGVLRYESKRPSEIFIPNYGLKPKGGSCSPKVKMQTEIHKKMLGQQDYCLEIGLFSNMIRPQTAQATNTLIM